MKRMWSVRLARKEDAPAIEMLIRISARVLQSSHYSEPQIEGALGSVFGVLLRLFLDLTDLRPTHDNVTADFVQTSGMVLGQGPIVN